MPQSNPQPLPSMLAMEDVHYTFGPQQFRLHVPHLAITRGTTAVCIGPSGSGKTTLLNLMAGILLPQRGHVTLDGVHWHGLTEAARRLRRITRVGMVFQAFELLEHLTVRENILLPYFIQRRLRLDATAEQRAAELAAAAGIAALLRRRPNALSHGERQRVAICRALVTAPAVLLADEPTGNLDPRTAAAVLDLLLTQVRARQATLVMVTHDQGLVGRFDQVIAFSDQQDGAVVATGPSHAHSAAKPS